MSYLQSINHKVVELTPRALNLLSKRTPKTLLKSILQRLLNQLFKQSLAAEELNFLINKWVKITVTDMDFSFYVSAANNQAVQLTVDLTQRQSDLIFASDSDNLLLLALNKVDPDTLFFQRKLRIEGDTELGLFIKNLLASVDLTQQLPASLRKWINSLGDCVYQKMA